MASQELNADLTEHVIVHTDDMAWEETGLTKVSRKLLERVNDPEKGRETSLMRLEAGAALPAMDTDARMEIYVVDGTYSDESGDHAAGTYIMYPPGFRHTPSSAEGCVMFVKRRSGLDAPDGHMVIDTNTVEWEPWGHRGGVRVPFYKNDTVPESAHIGNMRPDVTIPDHDHPGGEEIFIFDGAMEDASGVCRPGTWVRFPVGLRHSPSSLGDGCRLYVREGDVIP